MKWTTEEYDRLLAQLTDNAEQLEQDGLDHAQYESFRKNIIATLTGSTVLKRYMQRRDRGRRGLDNTNTEPWHAEGERQYAALLCATIGLDGGLEIGSMAERFEGDKALALALSATMFMLVAEVYLWSTAVQDIADATPLPRHVVSFSNLPHPVMFWSNEAARGTEDWDTNFLLLTRTQRGLRLTADMINKAGSPVEGRIVVSDIQDGMVYPDDFDAATVGGVGALLARIAFLNSPYIGHEVSRLPRAFRRHGFTVPAPAALADPAISVVTLRRETHAALERQASDEASGVIYKHQWWVSGHIRAQWYPSERAHQLIWIAPYLKGDPSKPMISRVYAVTR